MTVFGKRHGNDALVDVRFDQHTRLAGTTFNWTDIQCRMGPGRLGQILDRGRDAGVPLDKEYVGRSYGAAKKLEVCGRRRLEIRNRSGEISSQTATQKIQYLVNHHVEVPFRKCRSSVAKLTLKAIAIFQGSRALPTPHTGAERCAHRRNDENR